MVNVSTVSAVTQVDIKLDLETAAALYSVLLNLPGGTALEEATFELWSKLSGALTPEIKEKWGRLHLESRVRP